MGAQIVRRGGRRPALIGRETETATIHGALATGRLVTLTGLGGVGKTSLALALAESARDRGAATGIVDLAPISDAAAVPGAVATAVGARESASVDVRGAIPATLGTSPFLLVLDNFEQVLSAAPFVSWLLSEVPALRILITSRVPLALDAERVVRIDVLRVPANGAEIEEAPASRLFLSKAGVDDPADLSAADRAAVARICRALDGLPLALELAASWTTILSPRAIDRRLDAHDLRLEGGPGDRQPSVERIVSATLELVGPEDRAAFDALGTFVGAFDEAALRAVLGRDDALVSLRALARVALVEVAADSDGEPSFRLLETTRAVAEARLSTEARRNARRRHAIHYLARAEAAADRLRSRTFGDPAAAAMLEDPNLLAAFMFAVAERDAELGTRMAAALSPGAIQSGRLSDSVSRLEVALELGPVPDAVRADALNSLVSLRGALGVTDQVDLATAAIAAAREAQDPAREARTLVTLGNQLGPAGLGAFEEAIRVGTRSGYHWLVATANMNLGARLQDLGQMDESAAAFGAAGAAYEAAGDRVGRALALVSLGELYMTGGRSDLAIGAFEDAVPALRESGPAHLRTTPFTGLALLLAQAGDTAGAWVYLSEAAEMAMDTESPDARNDIALAAANLMALDEPAAAARAIGATTEATLVPAYRAQLGPITQRLARTLGPARFARERRAGARSDWQTLAAMIAASARAADPTLTLRLRTAFETFTPREAEVLRLLADGATDPSIAAVLHIAPKTASVHVGNVKAKLGARSRIEAAFIARRMLDDIAARAGGSAREQPAIPDRHGRD